MKTMVIVALIVLSAAASLPAAAQTSAPNVNQQSVPQFAPPQETVAFWYIRTPVASAPRQCRVGGWYLAQLWNTDAWGHTVTWLAYVPYYVCY